MKALNCLIESGEMVVQLTAQDGSAPKFCAETMLPAATIAKSVVFMRRLIEGIPKRVIVMINTSFFLFLRTWRSDDNDSNTGENTRTGRQAAFNKVRGDGACMGLRRGEGRPCEKLGPESSRLERLMANLDELSGFWKSGESDDWTPQDEALQIWTWAFGDTAATLLCNLAGVWHFGRSSLDGFQAWTRFAIEYFQKTRH
jgi:hypothetical protein